MTQKELDRLRDWYLARLRKLAMDDEVRLSSTPNALVLADRAAVEAIIMQATGSRPGFVYSPSSRYKTAVAAAWFIVAAVATFLFFI